MIHIVDDDDAVRLSMRLLMQSFGWRSRAFASAREFLEASPRNDSPACLLLDLNMPGMNGAELAEMLAGWDPRVPVIVITGEGNTSQLAARARNAGVAEVLHKPFREDDLKATIDRVLAKH